MQECRNLQVRAAVESLLKAALSELAERDSTPKIGKLPDPQNWWRYGQETFVASRPAAWDMPGFVTMLNWLETFAQMAQVRATIAADPILNTRVDSTVGTEFALRPRRLDWLLVKHLLEPMIVASRGYRFDKAVFDRHFDRLEAGMLADTVRFVEFVPLNGFMSSMAEIALPDDVVVRPMSDHQISRAIQVLAVPAEFGAGPNSVQVSRFHQWAVMREQAYPVYSGRRGRPEHPKAPDFPSLIEPADRLVTALRLVCGGSVTATRPIHAQHDEDFPLDAGCSAYLSPVDAADANRPTLLLTDKYVDTVRRVYQMLATAAVEQNRSLRVGLRRFVIAGSRSLPEDRLIDLSICSEALLLQRHRNQRKQKGALIAAAAGQLLAEDPRLRANHVERQHIERFLKESYKLRNAEIHGESNAQKTVTLLCGAETNDLARIVEDLALVLGQAIQGILTQLTHCPGMY